MNARAYRMADESQEDYCRGCVHAECGACNVFLKDGEVCGDRYEVLSSDIRFRGRKQTAMKRTSARLDGELVRVLSRQGTLYVLTEDGRIYWTTPFANAFHSRGRYRADIRERYAGDPDALIAHFRSFRKESDGWDYGVKSVPSIRAIEKWERDGVSRATDGCRVEPDGTCEHGRRSWLLVLGMI